MSGRRIAVIGGGVSGITAGYILSHSDHVTLFEADGRLGGHADTHLVMPPAGPPLSGCQPDHTAVRISYHLNRLQDLPASQDYIVTLGGQEAVDPEKVLDRMDYAHPAYTPASVAAQHRLPGLNTSVIAFAGAYHGWGFHEDGCRTGAAAARALGGTW